MFVTKAAVRTGTCAEELLLGPERFVRRGCPFCACVKILWIKERRGRICRRIGGLVCSDCAPGTAVFVGCARQGYCPLIPLEAARRPCITSRCLPSLRSGTTWMNPQSPGWGSYPAVVLLSGRDCSVWGVISDPWYLVPDGLHAVESPWLLTCQQIFCSGCLWKWDGTNQISGVPAVWEVH